MFTYDQFHAVIVTRGDVDLAPVIDSLIFPNIVIWDNRKRDFKTWGRYVAASRCGPGALIYSQDDDIIHTPENQLRIVEAYEPGVLTGCMWPEWSQGAKDQGIPNGYDDLVFAGSGSVWAMEDVVKTRPYLERYGLDDFFHLWADTIVGVLAPTKQLDIRFEARPCAEADNRMCNLPNAVEQKTEAIRRAREVRENACVT